MKKRLTSLLPEMVSAAKQTGPEVKEGWPGRMKGDKKGNVSTGWCKPIQ